MKKIIINGLVFFISTFCHSSIAQPSYIYEGGNGCGYFTEIFIDESIRHYRGGNGSGYGTDYLSSGNFYIMNGGSSQGYTTLNWVEVNDIFYSGSEGEGYTSIESATQTNTFYEGGSSDGYAMTEKCEDFIWTGVIGTGWAVEDNWNYNKVPDLKRKVIIPPDVPFFPFVNAGIFAIGDNPNNGVFECRDLWIQDGALLVTRINTLVENYSKILIDGTMQVKNSSFDAFQNQENGLVRITSTGSLLIKP